MKYTENYHLPQWVKSDRIMMDDFNAAMANLENGITTAQTTADEALGRPYVVGTYVGNGTAHGTAQEINLGFRPRFIIISGQVEIHGSDTGVEWYSLATAGTAFGSLFATTDTGFRVVATTNDHPNLNFADRIYDYIAFR